MLAFFARQTISNWETGVRYNELITQLTVYKVVQRLSCSKVLKVFKEHFNISVLCIGKGKVSGNMRRNQKIFCMPEPVPLRKGLLLENIKSSTGKMTAFQSLCKGIFVNCRTAAYVYKVSALRQKGKPFALNNALSFCSCRKAHCK